MTASIAESAGKSGESEPIAGDAVNQRKLPIAPSKRTVEGALSDWLMCPPHYDHRRSDQSVGSERTSRCGFALASPAGRRGFVSPGT